MDKAFILCCIDDDEVYQFTMSRSVKIYDLAEKILSFADGEEAMTFLSENMINDENLPDIIFLDINMPIMDGWHFLDEYVKLKPRLSKKITIYMVTSSVSIMDKNYAKKISEISGYIVKPVKPETLKEIINGYVPPSVD